MSELLRTESTLLFDCEDERCGRACPSCYGARRIGMSNAFRNAISIAHSRALARIFTTADELPHALVLDGIDYLHSAQHFAPAAAARHWDCADEIFEVLQGWAREFLAADDDCVRIDARKGAA